MSEAIKLSAPATREFWEIPILFEDDHMLALDKPSRLLTSPDRYDPQRPNLMKLLHAGIERGAPWARQRGLTYLMNAHRLDFETSGVLLLAKDKPMLVTLANCFGEAKVLKRYSAMVHGNPPEDRFTVDARLAPHPVNVGVVRVDPRNGKRARTEFEVAARFKGHALLQCRPLTGRTHQIRAHLRYCGFPIVADRLYGGSPLLLSELKSGYRFKADREERPLMDRVALHAELLTIPESVRGASLEINSPCPKDFSVAVKYLRRYAAS